MKTYVYVDGFNLYYGALKKSPYKWLDISMLCTHLLHGHDIEKIKYFTAPMKVRDGEDPDKSNRQQIYLRALRTLPNVEIVEGFFMSHVVNMRRARGKGYVDVIKTEEKGTDVKLAAHLLHDGHQKKYEMAVVISNDADLAEPIRMVVQDLKLPVVVISPFEKNTLALAEVASARRQIRKGVLRISQFPNELVDDVGTFTKPERWGIKAMVFDADGVLITATERFSSHLEAKYRISTKTTLPFFTGVFQDCLVGKADLKKAVAKQLPRWGWKGTTDAFLKVWFESEHKIFKPLIEEVRALKKRGIKCYIATNNEKYRTEYISKTMGFGKIFDYVFSSAHIGHLKHNVAYFEHIVKKIAPIRPHEIVFWDDAQENVQTARRAGWNAEFYTSFEEFKQKMELYLPNS